MTFFERFYYTCLDLLQKLGTYSEVVFEWLISEHTIGDYQLSIIELLFGSGVTLVLAFLLGKIILSLIS